MEWVGAAVFGGALLFGWLVGLVVVYGMSWMVLRLGRRARNRRKAVLLAVPLAALALRTIRTLSPVWLVLLAVWAGSAFDRGERPMFPAVGTRAHLHGEILFCVAFGIFAVVLVPRAYGFSVAEGEAKASPVQSSAITMMRLHGGILIGLIASQVRGPLCVVPGVLLFALALLLAWLSLSAHASARFLRAPEVAARKDPDADGALLFIQVSDVHVTDREDRVPTGGGRSGVGELRSLAAAIETRDLVVPLVIVSGDLVDTGDEAEWRRAMEPLRAIRAAGVRVVLAPGNHDLHPSYSPSGLLWAGVRPGGPVVDGARARRLLDAAVELEPALEAADGRPLAERLAQYASPWPRLCGLWDAARAEAATANGLPPGVGHAAALARYRRTHPEAMLRLQRGIIELAHELYPLSNRSELARYFERNLYVVGPGAVAEFFESDPWQAHWYDPYPLRVGLPEHDLEVIVVNSNPPDPLLLESALGRCGEEQLGRLEKALQAPRAGTIVVAHHHSLARWKDDAFAFQRWGTLAHDSDEARRLLGILGNAAVAPRRAFLLTGHVHETSRRGLMAAGDGFARDFWLLESAALGEPGGRRLLAARRIGDQVVATAIELPDVRSQA